MTSRSDERRRAGNPMSHEQVTLRRIKDRHRFSCPDNATQQYAEQAHADVLWLLTYYQAAEHR